MKATFKAGPEFIGHIQISEVGENEYSVMYFGQDAREDVVVALSHPASEGPRSLIAAAFVEVDAIIADRIST